MTRFLWQFAWARISASLPKLLDFLVRQRERIAARLVDLDIEIKSAPTGKNAARYRREQFGLQVLADMVDAGLARVQQAAPGMFGGSQVRGRIGG